MVDKEKLIRGLHCCAHTDGINCMHCPYDKKGEDCTAQMSMDILALLKEQEAMRCKNCRNNHQCAIQFKFADADDEENWFCKDFTPSSEQAVKWE